MNIRYAIIIKVIESFYNLHIVLLVHVYALAQIHQIK